MEIKTTEKSAKSRYAKIPPLLAQTKGLLHRFGIRASKGLGQHFLIDEEVLKDIVSAAQLTLADTVLEIGPGLGVLTRELASQAGHVVAVELDSKLADILKQTLAAFNNVTIINDNILDVDPVALLQGTSYKVVANLPYYITSPILRHFLEASIKPQSMVLMVQKEVAEEISAKPGRMSVLSINVQFYGEPEKIRYVPTESFFPAPEVDSAVLRIKMFLQPAVEVDDRKGFFRLVRAGFSASRKQLANSLAQGLDLPKGEVLALLDKAGIDSQRRPQTLTLEEWAHLWRVSKE